MSFFQSSNPTLSEKIFDKSLALQGETQGVMSVRGTINKFGFMLLLVACAAVGTWSMFYGDNPSLAYTLTMVGLFGGLVIGLVTGFVPKIALYTAPAYALLEGLFLGGLSAIINERFGAKMPGIVPTAVGLTLAVAFAMFLLYNFRIIKPNNTFRSIVYMGTAGLAIFYLVYFVASYFFSFNLPFMNWEDTSLLGFGITIVTIIFAALSLILDLERIEEGAEMGLPKHMEWYCAFGLMATLVWLYIQMLKLLSRFASRD
ncbi:MAG: Bax inhibitor-1/YccA family membrane protein [Chitinophagaceae bacterium]